MRISRRIVVVAAGAAVLAAGGGGIAYAVGGDSAESVSGPAADRAKRAALAVVGNGTVLEVERQDGDGAGAFEVEVRRADGSQVEIHLDAEYRQVGSAPDDDTGGGSDDDSTDAGEGEG